ncbi:MAG TPA: DUF5050 domain-containing protein [Proteiniclasticum sp.]|nr:DUF5050 domain-containing protein [Proteiniclasticum sp.]
MKRNIGKCILLSFALSAFFLNGCSAPSTNSETPENSQTPEDTETLEVDVETPEVPTVPVVVEGERMGNTNSNILNGGHAVLHKDWIYYMNFSEENSLFRMKTDGTEESLVAEDIAYLLNASGDWLYYASGKENGRIFKIRPDGSEKTLVIDRVSMNMIVSEEHIYFIDFSNESGPDRFKIFRVRTDGTQRQKIVDHTVSYFSISDEWIYYLKEDEQKIHRVNKDGSEDTKVSDTSVFSFTILDSSIYYTPYPNESGLYKMNMDGTGNMELTDEPIRTFTVCEEWIYYDNIIREASKSDEDKSDPVVDFKLKKMRLDGTEAAVLENQETLSLSICGDWIIYALMDEPNHSIRQTLVKTDGTGRKDFIVDLTSPEDNVESHSPQVSVEVGDLSITVNSAYSTNFSSWSPNQDQFQDLVVDGSLLFVNMTVKNESTKNLDLENLTGINIGNNTYMGQYADVTDQEEISDIRFHFPLSRYSSSIILKPGETKEIQAYFSPDDRTYPVSLVIVDKGSFDVLTSFEILPDEEHYVPTEDDALNLMEERFPDHQVQVLGQRVMDQEEKIYYAFEVKKKGAEESTCYLMKRDTEEIFYGVPDKNEPGLLRLGEPLE